MRGDTVREVLSYVQWNVDELISQLRRQAEAAVRAGRITLEESALLMRRYEGGLRGYTYLEADSEP